MTNPSIWVLLEAGETHELFASLDDETIDRLAEFLFEYVEDPYDPDAPTSPAQVRKRIVSEVIEGEEHQADFSVFELRRQPLNTTEEGVTLLSAPGFPVSKGARVLEAANRIVMGCDMCCALAPIGYFSERVDVPETEFAEWRELVLS